MKKLLIKIVKPFIKRVIIREIQNDEYRDMAIEKLQKRVPDLKGPENRKNLLRIYDAMQEIAEEVVELKFEGK